MLKETHTRGYLSVEKNFTSMLDCDFGIQVAPDGRVWICINGQAFIRFKPKISALNNLTPGASTAETIKTIKGENYEDDGIN